MWGVLGARLLGTKGVSVLASFVGGISIIALWQEASASPYAEVWKIVLTGAGGVFLTLCGVIYRDMNRRMLATEQIAREWHLEHMEKLEKLSMRQERMLGVIITMALSQTDGSGEKLIQAVNSVLEKS